MTSGWRGRDGPGCNLVARDFAEIDGLEMSFRRRLVGPRGPYLTMCSQALSAVHALHSVPPVTRSYEDTSCEQ